jgi:hypothetical protein
MHAPREKSLPGLFFPQQFKRATNFGGIQDANN